MDCSLPGSSVHGIFQARVLEWGAIAFSKYPKVVSTITTTKKWNKQETNHERVELTPAMSIIALNVSGLNTQIKRQRLSNWVKNKSHLCFTSEKAMAPHSSTLAWKIPWMKEPGRLQSMGSLRVRHDWVTSFHFSLSCIGEGNGNPLQDSCLENSMDGEPGGLPSMGSHRVEHDWSDLAAACFT